jgi:hypothetical protein
VNVYHRLFIFLRTIKVVAWELASPSNPMYVLLPEPHWNKKVQFRYKTLPAIHLGIDSKKASNS